MTFAASHRRWGYRRAWVKAREAGFDCGRDVVRRIWRQEGLRVVPRKGCQAAVSAPIHPSG
ncbi:transposase [Trueperella pecoris]|nr:transposase [Trueperella pecoris]